MPKVIRCRWLQTALQEGLWEVEFLLDERNNDWKFPHRSFSLFWEAQEGLPTLFNADYAYELVFEQTTPHGIYGMLCLKHGEKEVLPTNWQIRHIRPYLSLESELSNFAKSIEEGLLTPDSISVLDLSHQELTVVPEEILAFKNLEKLLLHDNQLCDFPSFLGELQQLKQLDISHNRISILPPQLGKLALLRSVFMLGNTILELPEAFGQLAQLEVLHLQHNKLSSLPDSFCELKALRELDLHDNLIERLPECLRGMKQLKSLKLGVPSHFGNPLSQLPEWIGELRELEEISLAKTILTAIPKSFSSLKKLRVLWLPQTIDSIDILNLKSVLPNLTIMQH